MALGNWTPEVSTTLPTRVQDFLDYDGEDFDINGTSTVYVRLKNLVIDGVWAVQENVSSSQATYMLIGRELRNGILRFVGIAVLIDNNAGTADCYAKIIADTTIL